MLRRLACVAALVQLSAVTTTVSAAQQRVMLSDSYLPVVMQVIANLVDQMAYETNDQQTSTPTSTTSKPTSRPTSRPTTTAKPTSSTTRLPTTTAKPHLTTSSRPSNQHQGAPWKPVQGGGWSMGIGVSQTSEQPVESTTSFHKPGLFAPLAPPKPNERLNKPHYALLPIDDNADEYTVINHNNQKIDGLLSPETHSDIRPILEDINNKETLLPPIFKDDDAVSRSAEDSSLELLEDELNENNLQYISKDLKEMLNLAHDPKDERAFDINDDGMGKFVQQKTKLSQSNLRLLLLYDLLSREAKRQKLSDFGGFTQAVIHEMSQASSGGARSQLGFSLAKMLERKDCQHEYANNRAKEMVAELKKDDSLLSSEVRYLRPIAYNL